jgi:hypothetical protein
MLYKGIFFTEFYFEGSSLLGCYAMSTDKQLLKSGVVVQEQCILLGLPRPWRWRHYTRQHSTTSHKTWIFHQHCCDDVKSHKLHLRHRHSSMSVQTYNQWLCHKSVSQVQRRLHNMRSALSWDFTQHRMVVCYRCFRTTYRSHLPSAKQSKKIGCPETSVTN